MEFSRYMRSECARGSGWAVMFQFDSCCVVEGRIHMYMYTTNCIVSHCLEAL